MELENFKKFYLQNKAAFEKNNYDGIYANTYDKDGLTEILIDQIHLNPLINMKTIPSRMFSGTFKTTKSITVPKNIQNVDDSAFGGMKGVEEVVWDASVKSIPEQCFQNSNVKVIKIADGVEEIEYDAFRGCNELLEVHIPDTCWNIKSGAFRNCDKVQIFMKHVKDSSGKYRLPEHEVNVKGETKKVHFALPDGDEAVFIREHIHWID